MTYPLSSAVVVGQATEADQYNNLRRDALYLGGEPDASGTLLDLLGQETGGITLTRNGKTGITLTASADEPAALMINGSIFSIHSSATLSLSADTLPNAGRYSIYAIGQSDGSFTLSAGVSLPSGGRRIGSFIWDGNGIIPDTVHTLAEAGQLTVGKTPGTAGGRLTLVSGDPLPDSDITRGDTLYFVPYRGNVIGLYLDGDWEYFHFTALSLNVRGLLREIPYDVFLSADADGLKLSVSAWAGVSARPAGTLQWQDGVRVSGADSGKRYIGSFALNAEGYAEDSATGRLLWNENNRADRPILAKLLSVQSSGTSVMDAWVPYYNDEAPEVRLLIPAADAEFTLDGVGLSSTISASDISYGRAAAIGIGQDMAAEAPYTGNRSCVPVFTHTGGNGPMTVRIRNQGSSFQGCHRYTLAFWTNYSFTPIGTSMSSGCGENPGLSGSIKG